MAAVFTTAQTQVAMEACKLTTARWLPTQQPMEAVVSSTLPSTAPRHFSRSATVRSVTTPLKQGVVSIMKVIMTAAHSHRSLKARSAATRPVASVEVACSTQHRTLGARGFNLTMRFLTLARREEIFRMTAGLLYLTATTLAAI